MIELRPLTLENVLTVLPWRREYRETLRTPYMLTEEMQADYYKNVICNRESRTRYWGVWAGDAFVGYGGLENISWENGNAEISLLIGPEYQRKGYGKEAVRAFLAEAFGHMRLHAVFGECYKCGPWRFWAKLGNVDPLDEADMLGRCLPARKYHDGQFWDSYYFTFYEPIG